jgi:hypothetical protein
MSVKVYKVKEGEFVRLMETRTINKIFAQESIEHPLKFCIVGLNEQTNTAYMIRHARTDDCRTWRLDSAAKFLNGLGVVYLEVQFKQ